MVTGESWFFAEARSCLHELPFNPTPLKPPCGAGALRPNEPESVVAPLPAAISAPKHMTPAAMKGTRKSTMFFAILSAASMNNRGLTQFFRVVVGSTSYVEDRRAKNETWNHLPRSSGLVKAVFAFHPFPGPAFLSRSSGVLAVSRRSMEAVIRLGQAADAFAIAVLMEQLGYPVPASKIEERLGRMPERRVVLVAVVDGEVDEVDKRVRRRDAGRGTRRMHRRLRCGRASAQPRRRSPPASSSRAVVEGTRLRKPDRPLERCSYASARFLRSQWLCDDQDPRFFRKQL